MKLAHHLPHAARVRRGATSLTAVALLLSTGLVLPLSGAEAATAVSLGTAENFAILAGSTITNTGATTVTGDVGLYAGTSVTGFGPGANQVTQDGSLHVTDEVASQAKNDLGTAYTNAAGQTPATEIPTELGGKTLAPGVYDSVAGTFGVTGTLTLDGENNPDSVFIFQMGSTLTTASASRVSLINGADLCNVYWQVGSSATLGSDSDFLGTILANQSITLNTGANVQGRVLARVAAVTLDNNVITNEACVTPAADGETPTDETPTDEAPVDETPVAETPTDETPVDETPVEGDVPAEDDSASGEDTPAAGGTPTGDSTSQVRKVPGGSVAAGGGDAPVGALPMPLVAVAMLLMVGGTAGVIVRRRIQA